VGTAAENHDALVAQSRLDCRPVDDARPNDLLRPPLPHLRGRMVRARLTRVALRGHRELAVSGRARVDGSMTHATGRLRAAHHTTGTVDGRVQRLLVLGRLDALEDDGLIAHRAA